MSTDRSREAFGRFLDFLGEKGLMSPATAQTRKASGLKLLSILDDKEASDVTKVDVDALAHRYSNLHGQSYSPGSLNAYRSRLKSALADFQSYLENPLSFRPAGQSRSARARKENRESVSKPTETQAEPPRIHAAPAMSGVNVMPGVSVMPIPIRADLTILIHGLPHDLTVAEAKKISGVINALATEA